ncbi:ATP binding protein, putative [Ricinus communis]|uniref:ATP binding protein, putative n=1 Tax=Ricinus communis TaxID=3988 RepID=B9SFD8_RICCO|nr:ATP binding protein, putative [Ricinus communis]
MAQDIENCLLEKLNNDLESSKVPLAKKFKDLIKLLKEKLESCSSSDIPALRGQLYFLNDIFSECRALSEQNSGQSGSSAAAASEFPRSGVSLAPQVYSFDDEITSLEKSLVPRGRIDCSFKATGIVGNGGAGKSRICRLFLTQPKVKRYFIPRIWVDMSKRSNEDNDPKIGIVKRMLDSLGVEEKILRTIFDEHGLGGLICSSC